MNAKEPREEVQFYSEKRMKGGVVMAKNIEKDVESEILKERNRLRKIFKGMDENKFKTFEGMIDNAAFMRVTLRQLEQDIKESGYAEIYQNGREQSGVKTSAAAGLHLSMTKNYTAVIKLLAENVPAADKKTAHFAAMLDDDE